MDAPNQTEARIAISVPRELHARLKQLRPRIRVTRTCLDALEAAARREEGRAVAAGEIERLIERLRTEKEQVENRDQEVGFRDGRNRALTFGYTDFKLFERIADTLKRYGQGVDVEEVVTSVLKDHNRDFLQLFWAEDPGFTSREHYLEGYITGVMHLWNEVSEKI